MRDLTITGIQCDLKWQDKDHNLEHFHNLIAGIGDPTDLIILPEMFSTAFSMDAGRLAETMDGPSVQWMTDTAREFSTALCGSLIISVNEKIYNRFIFVDADGSILATYDKHHLFSLLGEHKPYCAGTERAPFGFRDWLIQPFICYDLRFPVWCRNDEEAHLQLYVANWPERRIAHWSALLRARAIENQCYVAGINRIGDDANGVHHTGASSIFGPYGKCLAEFHETEAVFTQTLSAEHLADCRKRFPFLADRDNFEIN